MYKNNIDYFERKILRRVFGILYKNSSGGVDLTTGSMYIRWARHIACIQVNEIEIKIMMGHSDEQWKRCRHKLRWLDRIEADLKETRYQKMNSARMRPGSMLACHGGG